MKNRFLSNVLGTCVAFPIFIVSAVFIIVIGAVYSQLFAIILGSFIFAAAIVSLFLIPEFFSFIKIDKEKIAFIKFKKNISVIKWDEVKDVKMTPHAKGAWYLTFISENGKVEFLPRQKVYDAIISVCPANIKFQIENIDKLACFRKK